MAELTLTGVQLLGLLVQHRDALAGKMRFSDILMPNGETLANCAEDYIWQVGTAMSGYGCRDLAKGQTPDASGDVVANEVDKMLFGTN